MSESEVVEERWGKSDATHDPCILAHFKPRADDVLITTAPKAGTTWMQQILHQLRSGGDDRFDSIDEVVPWLELPRQGKAWQQRLLEYDAIASPRVFKTHCTFEQTPGGVDGAKIILSSRDPRDCCVSFYHHQMNMTNQARKLTGRQAPASFDEFFERWIEFAAWFRNVASWWPHRQHHNVLWLRYEDMKANFETSIDQILDFLDWALSKEQKQRAMEFSSFAWMKQHADKFAARDAQGNSFFKAGKFIRKGEVGDYKTILTPEHEAKIFATACTYLPADALAFFNIESK